MNILGRLLTGLALWVAVAAVAQKRPPNYSQESMPATSFSCRDKIIGGYYADPETDCQMFHVCVKVPGQGVQDYRFLCPNDTSFDQENQICDDWFNIDCEASTLYYSDNFDLYRIGGDIPRTNLEPRLPSNNINNAVSEIDDGFYLQKSDRGENVGSDLLRGSHSSNFFSNKNRGREDDDYSKDDHKKTRGGNVKKLLTGKRPLTATQAPVEESKVSQPQYRPKTHNFAGRVSQFQRTAQQQTTVTPVKITETHNNRQSYTQRNYYSPTTPKIETTSTAQRTELFRNYNPTTKRSFYENTQNYNTQTTPSIQTTRNYQNFRTTTQAPTTVNYYETTLNYEKNNNYETQKLYKLNTGALNQYDDSKDEFLKTAPSLNLGASAFNSLQSSIKNINTNVSSVYNFNLGVKSTTDNYQSQTYFNPTTLTQNYYNPSTPKSYQQEYFTTAKPQVSDAYKQQFYNPQAQQSTTVKDNYQYSQTTQKPFQQQYTYSTESTYTQYNPTTLNPFNQQILSTKQPIQQYNNQAVQQYNQPIQPYNNQPSQQTYQTQKPPSQQLTYQTQKPSSQPETYTPQRNTPTQKPFQPQRNSPTQQSLQLLRDTPAQQSFQHPQISQNLQQQYQPQRSTKTQKLGSNTYYNPTTLKLSQTIKPTSPPRGTRPTTLDATEQPRPFTQDTPKKDQKKEKEQYDYAYYDDGTQAEYDNLEPVEDFSRTKSKN